MITNSGNKAEDKLYNQCIERGIVPVGQDAWVELRQRIRKLEEKDFWMDKRIRKIEINLGLEEETKELDRLRVEVKHYKAMLREMGVEV